MRILYICDEYPPGKNGGIGTMVQVMARQLVRSGHAVMVVGLYGHDYGSQDFEMDEGVEVHRYRYGFDLKEGSLLWRVYKKMPRFLKRVLLGKRDIAHYISEVKRLVNDKKMDVIEIADWSTLSFETGIGIDWPEFKCPLLVKLHGSYTYFQTELGEGIDAALLKNDQRLMQRADGIASVSLYTAEKTRALLNIDAAIEVLYNAIDIPMVDLNRHIDENAVFFSGSLVPKKGIYQLMKAWNLVIEKRPAARLWVYGKGSNKALKTMLSEKALSSVHFEGHVGRTELLSQLSNSALAVFPSYSETFGLMCIEAMSRACAVIYTKRSCGPEIITDGHDGALVDPDNVQEIADTILAILSDQSLRKKYAEKGYESVGKRFSLEHSVQAHLKVYEQLIHAHAMKQKNFNFTK